MAETAAAMARGEITPSEAATVAGVLDVKRRALELVELEQRVAALERQGKGGAMNDEVEGARAAAEVSSHGHA
jgi:hypothetical protein